MPAPSDSEPGRGVSPRERGAYLGDLCADRAERAMAEFCAKATAFVLDYLKRYGATSGEVVTSMAIAAGIAPPDARAFGPVFSALSRQKRIATVGWCARTKGHGTAGGRVWALA